MDKKFLSDLDLYPFVLSFINIITIQTTTKILQVSFSINN